MSDVPISNVSEQMRADWNQRAREDAHYYVAFGSRNQDEEGFLKTALDVVGAIEWEFKRFPKDSNRRAWRALEIGCGPGRLMKPLSPHFGEIHGVDVSDEMIRIARERLRDIPHAHVHATNGSSLNRFADQSFEIVYSYAVFQHIPSRSVVLEYMREIVRVLKPGGVFRGQFNSLPLSEQPDTWSGVSFTTTELRDFAAANSLQLLALEGAGTQYLWTTWRKPAVPSPSADPAPVSIRRITNASSSEPVVPNRGALAAISLWTVNLPTAADLNTLDVRIDGQRGEVVYIGPPEADGLQQINVLLPSSTRTGLVPVKLLQASAYLRVIPAGPMVPRIIAVTDGINIVDENRSTSGTVKIQLDEVRSPELITVKVGGLPVRELKTFCTDPVTPRYEVNFRLPEGIPPGRHDITVRIGKRALMPREIDVSLQT